MKPISFSCHARLLITPDEIIQQILDVTKWPEFQGYWPIPGIESAECEIRTPEIVGSRFRVKNLDGSTHAEEIVERLPDLRLRIRMCEFSAPLAKLATEFMETWTFQRERNETHITRFFEMHPRSIATKPFLWFISFFLKQGIIRHLREMKAAA